jgi:hypothetical protein
MRKVLEDRNKTQAAQRELTRPLARHTLEGPLERERIRA